MLAKSSQEFYKFLTNNLDSLNILDCRLNDIKFGHYGKILTTSTIIPENGRLYFETVYYPLSKKHFNRKRIAVSNIFVFSKHYMERLIERKNTTSIRKIKKEIKERFKEMDESNFAHEFGGLDLSTDFILVFRNSISFCVCEFFENGTSEAVMKTVISDKEIKPSQRKIIDYILEKTNSESCFLATHEIPRTYNEADNVIKATINRTSGIPRTFVENRILTEVGDVKFKRDKKLTKAFVNYLETYDPDSPKYQFGDNENKA